LIAIGTAGWALCGHGSLLEVFSFALPLGLVALVFAIWRLLSSRLKSSGLKLESSRLSNGCGVDVAADGRA